MKNSSGGLHFHIYPNASFGANFKQLLQVLEKIMETQAEFAVSLNAVNEKLTKIGSETLTLLQKISDLTTALETAGQITDPALIAARDALVAQAAVVDALVPDAEGGD